MRNLFLLKKDEHTDTESQDDHTNTETESVAPIRLTKPTTRIVQTVEIDIDSSMDSDTEERDTETQQVYYISGFSIVTKFYRLKPLLKQSMLPLSHLMIH